MRTMDTLKACVLAIDDSPDVLELLKIRLRPEGLRLVTGGSYEEGLALATRVQPDLILLDVDMPEHTGLDLCRRLKAESSTAHIPVIFLTASGDVHTKVHGFDLGAIDYVTKPFHPAELRARVRAALRMKRAQDMLMYKAQIDALTGLRNRAYLDEHLASEFVHSTRTSQPLSVIMMDLDHFKSLNDDYGHPFGDLVLQRIGDFLTRSIRPSDVACRYGGEEIALVLANTPLDAARAVAERIREQVRGLDLTPRGKRIVVTASFGVAERSELASRLRDLSPAHLIAAADEALYLAKADGRDLVRASVAMRRDSSLRMAPTDEIARAS